MFHVEHLSRLNATRKVSWGMLISLMFHVEHILIW